MAQKTILLQCVWCWASKMPRLTGHWTRAITPLNFFLPGTSYGRGVYFARDASFSVKYARGAVIALGLATFTLPEYWSGNIVKATLGWSYLHQRYFPDPRFFSTLWLMTQETQPFSLFFTIPSAILNILYLFNFSLQNVQISLLYLSSSTNRQICLSNFLLLLLGLQEMTIDIRLILKPIKINPSITWQNM